MRNEAYEGFETFTNAFKMEFKMHFTILMAIFLLQIVFLVWITDFRSYETRFLMSWCKVRIAASLPLNLKVSVPLPGGDQFGGYAKDIQQMYNLRTYAATVLETFYRKLLLSFCLYLLYPLLIYYFRTRAKNQAARDHIRGARLVTPGEYIRSVKGNYEKTNLPFGQVRMPVDAEPKHTFIAGRPGTGKTVCLSAILARLKEQNAKAIVYDNKGDYLSKFFDPQKDLIFNPLDARSVGWTLFNEIETFMDFDSIAASLIPSSTAIHDPFWSDAARAVFSGILHSLFSVQKLSNKDIWDLTTSAGKNITGELNLTPGGEAGHRFIENPESNQALGVLAVLMQHTRCFEYMGGCEGDFCIKDWLTNDKAGMIYITNYADVRDTLKPILSLFIDLFARRLLSLPDSYDRRVFVLLDELGTLQRLSSLVDFLTLSRSKGGCGFIGIQDYGKLDRIYSREIRQTIVNACSSSVIFAMADEAAKISSANIGEMEIYEAERTYSIGVTNFKDGTNISMRKRKEALLLPSEIEGLPDLTGIVKFPNHPHVKSKWQYLSYPEKNQPFVIRPDLKIENIMAAQARAMEQIEIRQDIIRIKEDTI